MTEETGWKRHSLQAACIVAHMLLAITALKNGWVVGGAISIIALAGMNVMGMYWQDEVKRVLDGWGATIKAWGDQIQTLSEGVAKQRTQETNAVITHLLSKN